MKLLRYMAVMPIDSIPKEEGLYSISTLENDIQYVSEEHYTRNSSKFAAIELASATIKGDYTHINASTEGKLYTLLTTRSNKPMSLNEMTDRAMRNANAFNREGIEVLIRNSILVTYPEDEFEIQLTLRDFDDPRQSYHKAFKPNTTVHRLENSLLSYTRVEDLKDNDIIAWLEMGTKGQTEAVTAKVQHRSVRNVARPSLTLIGIVIDPSTEDLDNTLTLGEVERLMRREYGLDVVSRIIADDMVAGYKYMLTQGNREKLVTPTRDIMEKQIEEIRELKELSVDETDNKLDIKPTSVAAGVLSPEDAEVAQTQRFAEVPLASATEVLDKYTEEEAKQKYYDNYNDIE